MIKVKKLVKAGTIIKVKGAINSHSMSRLLECGFTVVFV